MSCKRSFLTKPERLRKASRLSPTSFLCKIQKMICCKLRLRLNPCLNTLWLKQLRLLQKKKIFLSLRSKNSRRLQDRELVVLSMVRRFLPEIWKWWMKTRLKQRQQIFLTTVQTAEKQRFTLPKTIVSSASSASLTLLKTQAKKQLRNSIKWAFKRSCWPVTTKRPQDPSLKKPASETSSRKSCLLTKNMRFKSCKTKDKKSPWSVTESTMRLPLQEQTSALPSEQEPTLPLIQPTLF